MEAPCPQFSAGGIGQDMVVPIPCAIRERIASDYYGRLKLAPRRTTPGGFGLAEDSNAFGGGHRDPYRPFGNSLF